MRGYIVKSVEFKNSSVAKVFVLAASLMVAGIVVAYFVHHGALVGEEKIASEREIDLHLASFTSTLKDAETGQRGYLLTGEENYLEPYRQALAKIHREQADLRNAVSAGDLPASSVEKAISLSEEKLAELDQIIRIRRDNGLGPALAAVRTGSDKATMDKIRAEVAGMAAAEEDEIGRGLMRARSADVVRTVAFLLTILFGLFFLALAYKRISREISLREAAVSEAKRQKELLATTLTSIGDAVIVTDAEGRVTFLNPEAEQLTGWPGSEAAGKELPAVFRIINERTRHPAENPVEKVLRLGTVVGLANHTLLLARNGKEIPIDDSAAPIRQPGGPLFGVVLVFRDFSAQRNTEEIHSRLAAIVEFSGDAIFSKSLDGTIQTWNAGAERMFGYRPEEIVGKSVTILIPPEHLDEEQQLMERLCQGEPSVQFETVRLAKDGRRISVLVNTSPIRDHDRRVTGASKIMHDKSEVVAARQALALEKELLATTLSSIGDAVIVTDAEGRVTFLNPEAEQLTGWPGSEAAGKELPAVFRIINERTRHPAENPVEKVLRLGTVVGLANHTLLLARNGKEIPIDDSAAPIRQPGGPLSGVVLVFRDFTEQRHAQQVLTRSKEELESLVGERTAELREMISELQHVSYAISHDMRAPLRAMGAYAEILLEEAEHGLSPEMQDYCRRIITGARRLDTLIRDALNYSRAVLQQPPLEPVDLAKLLRGLLDTYPNLHPERADIRIDGNLPIVLGNESLLTQCFSNLLDNAVKFVSPGCRPKVCVRAETGSDNARIWVEDNGIGIPTEAQPRLFGMFQKLNNQYEGTGIGLAIVRKVVERMGGKVGVESEPDKGSRFWVDFRIARGGLPQKAS